MILSNIREFGNLILSGKSEVNWLSGQWGFCICRKWEKKRGKKKSHFFLLAIIQRNNSIKNSEKLNFIQNVTEKVFCEINQKVFQRGQIMWDWIGKFHFFCQEAILHLHQYQIHFFYLVLVKYHTACTYYCRVF